MPEDRTVLDHLLEGRDALQREVQRLTAAIDQLDSVLGRIGSATRSDGSGVASGAVTETDAVTDLGAVTEDLAATPTVTPQAPAPAAAREPVNPPVEVEAAAPETVPSRPRAARKAPAKKAVRTRRTATTEPPKSIRVHVLEMLQAENRDFGLAEIIDRVHAAGIQAHDDAVRSITIKLMKDGRVERVGRGQYRLARRGSAARASAAVATAPRITEPAPEPAATPAEPPAAETTAPSSDEQRPEAPVAETEPVDEADSAQPGGDRSTPTSLPNYTPSLNLGQPWNS